MENKAVSEYFGSMVFSDEVMRDKLPNNIYYSLKNTINQNKPLNPDIADTVANAMKDWAVAKGATHFTHWFQPLNDITAEKHEAFFSYSQDGRIIMDFSGKELVRGESDASSFPSGGLRQTFEARGYTAWDCTSPAFIKDSTLYIPTVFCSYTGEALDKKTPLLRSMESLNKQTLRLLRHIGDSQTKKVTATVGAEQEYFLIDRDLYKKRLDLLMCGRTLIGAKQPKGQKLNDHYYGKIRMRIKAFMRDLDDELWRLGVPSKIRHNEAAPAQHEVAPVFTNANIAGDHNSLMMDIMKRVAKTHNLAILFHEKPFRYVNGSGKHCNWALATDTGKNLLDPGKTPVENMQFLLILCAVIKAVDEYAPLLRYSISSLSNDERLGEAEAPPSIVSIFLGAELDAVLAAVESGKPYKSSVTGINLGLTSLPDFPKDNTDRNRTSPLAFTGNKFEFRMCGSSASIAGPVSILNTIVAEEFCRINERLDSISEEERHDEIACIIKEIIKNHKRVIYSGNNYSLEWRAEAQKRGLPEINSSLEAFDAIIDPEVMQMLKRNGVMMESECRAHHEIAYEMYAKSMQVEAETLQIMIKRQVIPAALKYVSNLAESAANLHKIGADYAFQRSEIDKIQSYLNKLNELSVDLHAAISNLPGTNPRGEESDFTVISFFMRDSVKPLLERIRVICDRLESDLPEELWQMPVYTDLMFRL